MTIKISLSEEQANAVRAIARYARLSESQVILGCATAYWNMRWDDAPSFSNDLLQNVRVAEGGHAGDFDSAGRLGCCVFAWMPPKQELAERVINAAARAQAKAMKGDEDVVKRIRVDNETGMIYLDDGTAYRWSGKRVIRADMCAASAS